MADWQEKWNIGVDLADGASDWQREYIGKWGDKRIDMRPCPPGRCNTCDRERMQELMNYTTQVTYQSAQRYGKSMSFEALRYWVDEFNKQYRGEDMYEGTSVNDSKLLKNLKKLDMDESEQLLLDAKVIDEKGNLTREGFAFVLTILFKENKSLIVSKLQAIKEANAPKQTALPAKTETDEAGKASA